MIGPLSKGTDFGLVPDDSGKPVGRMLHRCPECGEGHVLDVDPAKLVKWTTEHAALPYVQDFWPEISPAEREEFFVSGTCGRCWDRMFSGEEEEP